VGWPAAIVCFGLFLAVMAPWWIRDLSVFGSISPSSSNGRILWIRTYEQLFSASDVTTPATFFAQGAGSLVASRVGGLVAAIQVFAGTPLLFFLAPFAAVGWWLHRRDPAFLPWTIYAVTFLVFAGLVFAVHLPYGMALHSEMALVPHAYLLSVVGIAASVEWAARRRPGWNAATATRNFTLLALAVTWAFAILSTARMEADWTGDADMRSTVLDGTDIPAGDRLMSSDPGAFWYAAGIPGIITPDDPLDVVEAAARTYGVRWLELEQKHLVPSLEPVLTGRLRPAWLSAPLRQVWPDGASPTTSTPSAALYAVCLEPGDARCAAP